MLSLLFSDERTEIDYKIVNIYPDQFVREYHLLSIYCIQYVKGHVIRFQCCKH